MTTDKLGISVQADLGAEVRRSAREGGVSISAWIAEAVEKKLRHEAFVAFMENDWDGPEGAITVEERARAVAEFDALGWTPGTPIGTRRRPNGAGLLFHRFAGPVARTGRPARLRRHWQYAGRRLQIGAASFGVAFGADGSRWRGNPGGQLRQRRADPS